MKYHSYNTFRKIYTKGFRKSKLCKGGIFYRVPQFTNNEKQAANHSSAPHTHTHTETWNTEHRTQATDWTKGEKWFYSRKWQIFFSILRSLKTYPGTNSASHSVGTAGSSLALRWPTREFHHASLSPSHHIDRQDGQGPKVKAEVTKQEGILPR